MTVWRMWAVIDDHETVRIVLRNEYHAKLYATDGMGGLMPGYRVIEVELHEIVKEPVTGT